MANEGRNEKHMDQKKAKKITKYAHIAIIIIGAIFIMLSIFHNNLWFDESYSVGIVSHSFAEIWNIGANDVHPVLYYFGLHILYLIFGSNLIVYRIFSSIPIIILGILGYTHIRKDFGEKTGFLFSFLTFFLPISCVYAGEIRMYTWAMLFVSIMAIYAYRIYTQASTNKDVLNKTKIKNWVLFAIFSLASCYTHYYGLATAGVINVILFIYLIRKSYKSHKTNKESKKYTADLKCFTISAVVQILLYLPWIFVALIGQLSGLSNGFWIPALSFSVLLQIFTFQFTGNLDILFVSQTAAIIFGVVISAYAIYCLVKAILANKNKQTKTNNMAGYWAIGVYLIVFFCILIISIVRPILYARYFLNLTGLFIFFLAFFMAKHGKKILTIACCIIILIMSGIINYNVAIMNYGESNSEPLAYVQEDLQDDDMILFGNEGSGFALSMQLIDVPNCFYDEEQWNVDAAYAAFGSDLQIIKTLEPLDDYEGRIWIVNAGTYTIYEEFVERYGEENITLIKSQGFNVEYHGYIYTIALIEKTV